MRRCLVSVTRRHSVRRRTTAVGVSQREAGANCERPREWLAWREGGRGHGLAVDVDDWRRGGFLSMFDRVSSHQDVHSCGIPGRNRASMDAHLQHHTVSGKHNGQSKVACRLGFTIESTTALAQNSGPWTTPPLFTSVPRIVTGQEAIVRTHMQDPGGEGKSNGAVHLAAEQWTRWIGSGSTASGALTKASGASKRGRCLTVHGFCFLCTS